MSKLCNMFSPPLFWPDRIPMQGWKGPSPASEAVLYLPNTQGQVDDPLRDKVPEAPNYLLLGWEGGYKAFWVLLLPNLGSPHQAASCSCPLLTQRMLSNSTSFPPSAPSLGPVLRCLWFSRVLDYIS